MSLRFGLSLLLMFGMSQLMQQVDARKLCGDALNNALDVICSSGFPLRIPRDTDRRQSPEQALLRKWRLLALQLELDQPDNDERDDEALVAAIDEGRERKLHRPRREGRIIDDCCENGCTYDTLRLYCA
ncbi:probable insulin-like peptide 4 [Drosophila sulfurigaster albostrigata]|uniref:probable insulin-like peptide 4 n=1 Tax=Drosophila sulfurigaster albostrigata TaxID=89887 RepID=UPI002D21A7F8|nr:probable insulin-like peptide 4 [Drosophila sulfurigaster albostrigata]